MTVFQMEDYVKSTLFALLGILLAVPSFAQQILLQSTTSTRNSGLYDVLLPQFTKTTGIEVRVVAVGTGQAIRNARNCDGDVLLVHSPSDEEAFVSAGYGLARHSLMYNDFVIVGPGNDPVGLSDAGDVSAALTRLVRGGAPFVSRGDDSGTHKAERRLWEQAGLDPTGQSGGWYREVGAGMGATLNIAVGMSAYALTDRATWLSFGNKGTHRILLEGDPVLFNQYGIVAVNPQSCPNVDAAAAESFVAWMLSEAGQSAINAYRVKGKQLFFANGGAE